MLISVAASAYKGKDGSQYWGLFAHHIRIHLLMECNIKKKMKAVNVSVFSIIAFLFMLQILSLDFLKFWSYNDQNCATFK